MERIGDIFQEGTKYIREQMSGHLIDLSSKPDLYKEYQANEKIALPAFKLPEKLAVVDAIQTRKSVREYAAKPVDKKAVSYLLWSCSGIVRQELGYQFRAAPSAGALYPIETYLVVNNVEELQEGIYHYGIRRHELELLKKGSFGSEVCKAALDQTMCAEAAVVFIWSAIFDRSKFKYGQRAYRYIYLDAGHIAENLALAAVSIGLGSCQIGALYVRFSHFSCGAEGVRYGFD